MKKLLTILLALVVAASVATGCAKKDNTPDDVEVNTDIETPVEGEEENNADVETPVEDETDVDAPVEGETDNTEELPEVPELPVQPEVEPEGKPETPVEPEVEPETPVEPEVEPEVPAEEETPAADADLSGKTLPEIIDLINAQKPVELMLMPMEVDLTDVDALKYFTGLDSADKIKAAAVCEPMIGSIAYSSVLVRVNDAADAADVAEAMKNGIDQRKWMCVEADDLSVTTSGDLVYLFMIDTEYADTVTSAQMMEAFNAVCAG